MTIHLSVALTDAGWHPAAWRELPDRAAPFGPGYWAGLVTEAEQGTLDFVTIEDGPSLQSDRLDGPDGRTDRFRGRLDASLIAAAVAPLTRHVGLVPTISGTHAEPFHIATATATLDHVSTGRAGWRPQVAPRRTDAAHYGRREVPELRAEGLRDGTYAGHVADLFAELGDVVEVVRRLWDSWQDDAVIRDVATGRYIDRDRLHYVDFTGRWFSVKGPSITPRPPQGQPPVVALAHAAVPYRFAAAHADVVLVTPRDADHAADLIVEVRAAEPERPEPVRVYADALVLVGADAADRLRRLDDAAGVALGSDAAILAGTPERIADELAAWHAAGITGFRLRPAVLPHDLTGVTRGLVPELRARGLFRRAYEADTLRGLLGLPAAGNRYERRTA